MPTLTTMRLPPPKAWQEFEDLVLASLGQRWKTTTLQRNGRSGQAQAGVDVYGSDDIGRRVGIQCKNFKGALGLKAVQKEIERAAKFKGGLSALFVATTAETDARLQEEVRLLSDTRVAAGNFAVALLFWDDIVDGLVANPALLRAHYPQIQIESRAMPSRERLLAALEFGYYAPYLWHYVLLTFGEVGQMANTEPDTVKVIARMVEQRAQQLFAPKEAKAITKCIKAIVDGSYATRKDQESWDHVEDCAKRIATHASTLSSLLPISEGNVLETGITLGRLYHHVDDLPSKTVRDDVRRRLRGILPAECQKEVDGRFKAAAKVSSGYTWASRIYTCLDREIRWASF
ncbi:restriction endonuclease (plasmid) [Bradyrhizobium quebecense]|uniref:Restriction endonuclease n=1 Tax=Bradyrhizobium quebecense TaxID=2748629 RepID=A0A973X0U1_9BRAD|nr:restriction endonuclease [Bradyrhizobium quebecense]UGA49048.1 restriction endonuclease [Bradyrhizobium quebecense]